MRTEQVPLAVIFNPRSGSVDKETKSDLRESLEQSGRQFQMYIVEEGMDAETLALESIKAGSKQLLASGGDGTVMAVINAILKSGEDVVLSLSPGGTANLIAAALEIPSDVDEALKIALNGSEKRVDVGKCGDKYFALGVGVGLAEKLVSGTDEETKDKLGRIAYALAALKEMGTPARAYHLVGPGGPRTVHGVGIAVVNVGGIGGRIRFAPEGKVDDGLLDVCVLRRLGIWDAIRLASKALLGGLEDDRAVDYYQWPGVQIATEGLFLQIDGESVEDLTPVEITVIPEAVRVTVAGAN